MKLDFDVIIVGAGSAGCVLANRLSADPSVEVLLIEAGGWDSHPLIAIPMGARLLTRWSMYDWADYSEPDEGLNGRRNFIPHGKVIGGSSSINYMAHTRGHPADYDRWERAGARGWSYRDVLPYFKQIESWQRGEDDWRGGSGELGALEPSLSDQIFRAWRRAAEAHSIPVTEDFNGENPEGLAPIQYSVADGRRASSGRVFLRPALKRRNLTVWTDTFATRILFEGVRATGIECLRKGRKRVTRARQRVVLSAGAINSPHLLMLSGIGPAEHLRSVGIHPLVDLPVGKNLEDHLGFAMYWSRRDRSEFQASMRLDRVAWAMVRAALTGSGPASTLPGVYMAYLKSTPSLSQPDLELLFQLPAANADYWFPGIKRPFEDAFGIRAYLTGQESRGEILLCSRDPTSRPIIHYNSLSAPGDLVKLRAAFKLAWSIGNSPDLAAFRGHPLFPRNPPSDDAEIDAFIRNHASQQYHPAGTCRMGADNDSVLDPNLAVRGVEALNVVDASAMPHLVAGNPNVVIMMMAAKAAEMWRDIQPERLD